MFVMGNSCGDYLPLASKTLATSLLVGGRLRLKCDGTRTETRFRLSAKGQVHLNRRGRQLSRLLAAEVCASAVVMLDTPCSEVVWRVLSTHSIRHFPLHFSSRASSCAITFQLDSIYCQFPEEEVNFKFQRVKEPEAHKIQGCCKT
jgi:hypothetical protein